MFKSWKKYWVIIKINGEYCIKKGMLYGKKVFGTFWIHELCSDIPLGKQIFLTEDAAKSYLNNCLQSEFDTLYIDLGGSN